MTVKICTTHFRTSKHGRISRGTGGQVPQHLDRGDANANCAPRFCHIGTKMSVLWLSKYAKIRFRLGLCPGPRWGSSRRSPQTLSRLERGNPPHMPPHSIRTHLQRSPCVPQKSSQIYAYASKLSWDITTTQVNSALHPSGVAKSSTSFGCGKGGKVTSAYPVYFTSTLRL